MDYYAPVQLYALLAIGLALYSATMSRLALRYPLPDNTKMFAGADFLLFVTWIPLAMYQVALFANMSSEIIPYHDVSDSAIRLYKRIAYFSHVVIVYLLFFWMPAFSKVR